MQYLCIITDKYLCSFLITAKLIQHPGGHIPVGTNKYAFHKPASINTQVLFKIDYALKRHVDAV
jgi:hypothetical protein